MDVLSIVSNVQQVSPDQLAASQGETGSSNRFVLTDRQNKLIIAVLVLSVLKC